MLPKRFCFAFANAVEMHRQILERALSNEVITPGQTTLPTLVALT